MSASESAKPGSESARRLPETYRDCLDFLFRRNQFSIKLGLETINALLDRLGRPDRGCQAVVLETGLGGRLDATNAVMPALTAVTSISLDHTAILGHTVEEIWREKTAILKPGVPMVVQENRPHLLAELRAKAEAAG